mmetsp:Transcript_21523/g.46034  ORF Transcript_21523/g.46034 Transcript_21523/m.46034 type:complete len:194 (-) Transcript_21523:185-766(-)
MGIHDGRSSNDWYASRVEMVTCPETYPLWRTRRPVVLVLTDPLSKSNDGDINMEEDGGSNEPNSRSGRGVFRHHYRYLAVTPGAQNDGAHGLTTYNDSMEDLEGMLSKTKISSGNLAQIGELVGMEVVGGMDAMTSSNDAGPSFPVSLWENPFLASSEEKDDAALRSRSSARSMSAGALSSGALSIGATPSRS